MPTAPNGDVVRQENCVARLRPIGDTSNFLRWPRRKRPRWHQRKEHQVTRTPKPIQDMAVKMVPTSPCCRSAWVPEVWHVLVGVNDLGRFVLAERRIVDCIADPANYSDEFRSSMPLKVLPVYWRRPLSNGPGLSNWLMTSIGLIVVNNCKRRWAAWWSHSKIYSVGLHVLLKAPTGTYWHCTVALA